MLEQFSPRKFHRPLRGALVALASFVLSLLACVSSTTAQAQTAATLTFVRDSPTIARGEEKLIGLRVDGAERLFGADIELAFDPGVAEIVDPKLKLGPFLVPGFTVYNTADNTTGKARATFTQVAPTPPATGGGQVLSFTIRGTSGGDPKVRVTSVLLARSDGMPQPVIATAPNVASAPPAALPQVNATEPPGAAPTGNPQPEAATNSAVAPAVPTRAPAEPEGQVQAPGSAPAPPAVAATTDLKTDNDDRQLTRLAAGLLVLLALAATGIAIGRRVLRRNAPPIGEV